MAPSQQEQLQQRLQERLQERLKERVKELERGAALLREENQQLRLRLQDKQARLDWLLAAPALISASALAHYRHKTKEFFARSLPRLTALLTRRRAEQARIRLIDHAASDHLARQTGTSFRNADGAIREGFVFVSSGSPLFDASLLNERLLAQARDFSPADLINAQKSPLSAHKRGTGSDAKQAFDLFLPAQDERLATQAGWKKDGLILVDKATSGPALFGPYLDLPAGNYRVRVLLSPHHPTIGPVSMDLVSSSARIQHAHQHFTLTRLPKGAAQLQLELSSTSPITGLEVRVLCQGLVEMAISGVEISAYQPSRATGRLAKSKAKQS
jgi:hypothetical protein